MRQTDRRQTKASFNAPTYKGQGIITENWQDMFEWPISLHSTVAED